MVGFIMAIFGAAVGIFVAAKLFKPIVKMTILCVYKTVKRKNGMLPEKEILKLTVEKRYILALKDCPREETIDAITRGNISNIDQLIEYMLAAEKKYYKRLLVPFKR